MYHKLMYIYIFFTILTCKIFIFRKKKLEAKVKKLEGIGTIVIYLLVTIRGCCTGPSS